MRYADNKKTREGERQNQTTTNINKKQLCLNNSQNNVR